jgi:hypothetical protein
MPIKSIEGGIVMRFGTLTIITISALLLAVALPAGDALAQQKSLKDQIVGTWTLVSNYVEFQDGRREEPFGGDQKGFASFDTNGRFSWLIMGAARKKFAANNRLEGTPEENKAAVAGTVAYWGTYAVDDAKGTITYNIERSMYPNWDGTARTASVTIAGNELKQVSAPIPSSRGTYVPNLVWQRAK